MKNILISFLVASMLLTSGCGSASKPETVQDKEIESAKDKIENIESEHDNEFNLLKSKSELDAMDIFGEDGSLRYINGYISGDNIKVNIDMKNENGVIEKQELDVYPFVFITEDGQEHKILLSTTEEYQSGDGIFYEDLSMRSINACGWLIGEDQSILYFERFN